MEAKAENLKHKGHERTNSNGETVGTGRLRWERECENMTSPFVIWGVMSFGNSRGEEQGTTAVGREAPALGRESAYLFQGYQHDQERLEV